MTLTEADPRFYLAPSTIPGGGQGLFAKVALPAGDLFEAIGVLISSGSIADACTHFADAHKFRVGDNLLIPIGYAGMVNHSRQPNLEKVVAGDKVFLRALRDIEAGAELFFTYSDYAQQRFGLG